MDRERIQFGSRLKEQREARKLSLRDVSSATKIPERSLERLEDGRWSELPAEVFVRGFVMSYARCVGMDADDTARRYGELTQAGKLHAPTPSLADAVRNAAAPKRAKARQAAEARPAAVPAAVEKDAASPAITDEQKGKTGDMLEELRSLSRAILDAGRETRRMPLTLAVIILVIVATLTMSLLLSGPSKVGDGLSRAAITHTHRG